METTKPKLKPLNWERHISPESCKWLEENLEGFYNCIKEILKLVQQGGNSSGNVADGWYDRIPDLTEELSGMHKSMAERYNNLIGEIRDTYTSSILGSLEATGLVTPNQKKVPHNSNQSAGFEFSLSSGGGNSDVSVREGSESSLVLSSDSDSESSCSINKHLVSPAGNELLIKRITDGYEEELATLNKNIKTSEKEIKRLQDDLKKKESVSVIMYDLQAQLESAQNEISIRDAILETERKKMCELEIQIFDQEMEIGLMGQELVTTRGRKQRSDEDIVNLKSLLDSEKTQVLEMEKKIKILVADVKDRDSWIRELRTALNDAKENLGLEKAKLQSKNQLLEDEIKQCKIEILGMKSIHKSQKDSWHDEIEKVKAEAAQKDESMEALNKTLDNLKLKHDVLMAEKNSFVAQVDALRAELCSRDNLIQNLEAEQVALVAHLGNARKLAEERKGRIDGLEREMDRQRVVISERAEEKREAIRQLCFSLEHYRVRYNELLRARGAHKGLGILLA